MNYENRNSAPVYGTDEHSSKFILFVCLAICTLAVVLMAGLHILKPLDGDQASFLLGAKALENGDTLYLDYWDIKQPGIFAFYWVFSKLFGFNTWGVHLGEISYWVTISIALIILLRPLLHNTALAAFAPLVFLATYFSQTLAWHATQVESLIAGPIVISILFCANAEVRERGKWWRFGAAGFAAGVGLWLKLALAPVFLALFAAVWVRMFFVKRDYRFSSYFKSAGAVILGFLIAAAPGLLYLGLSGNLYDFYDVTVLYPLEVISEGIPQRSVGGISRVIDGLTFLLPAIGPFVVLMFLRLVSGIRLKSTLAFYTWMVIFGAAFSIALQSFSLWVYHFQIFFMPLAIVFIVNLDALIARRDVSQNTGTQISSTAAVFMLTIMMVAQLSAANWSAGRQFVTEVALDGISRMQFEAQVFPTQKELQAVANLSELDAPDQAIYVFGDPSLYHILNARQAVPVLGWFWELAAPSLFQRTQSELKETRPVRVYMTEQFREIVDVQAPEILEWLATEYTPISQTADGQWHALKGA